MVLGQYTAIHADASNHTATCHLMENNDFIDSFLRGISTTLTFTYSVRVSTFVPKKIDYVEHNGFFGTLQKVLTAQEARSKGRVSETKQGVCNCIIRVNHIKFCPNRSTGMIQRCEMWGAL